MRTRLLVMAGLVLAIAACQKPVKMAYSPDAHRIVPVVLPGETITWLDKLQVKFDDGDSPCKPNSDPCEIQSGLGGKTYSYSCSGVPCDPDIAVDDPGSTGVHASGADQTVDVPVHLRCDANGKLTTTPVSVIAGQIVGWGAFGSYVNTSGWTITFSDAAACKEHGPFDVDHSCTVQAGASNYSYSIAKICKNPPYDATSSLTVK